jgi:RNA polymerase sigma-70 factor (ECF subfamily)
VQRPKLVPQPRPTDGDIVRAVLAGDRERYAELVERYRDRYARYATRMLGSADAAEDAVQDAFVRAYDQLQHCRDPENFLGWFFLILRNRCFAEQRRSRSRAPLELAGDIAASDYAAVVVGRRSSWPETLRPATVPTTARKLQIGDARCSMRCSS